MAGCCDPRGCDGIFDTRFARHRAARYRRKGLDRTARRIVDLLDRGGLAGATVLEIGGGVGEIQLELLRRGAAAATNLELSPAYEAEATALAAEAGLSGRVRHRILDIAVDPDDVEPADVVVLHRVVCCYPDYARLLGAAAEHTRHRLVFSHPPRNPLSRAMVATVNALVRARGGQFRAFTHRPDAMLDVLAGRGLRPSVAHGRGVWRIATGAR